MPSVDALVGRSTLVDMAEPEEHHDSCHRDLLPDRARGGWTADDLDAFPDDGLRYELVDGCCS
jgi:hypothetical protein